jgi:hypothetical protein
MRDVRFSAGVRVCAGQSEFSAAGCRNLMEAGAIDVCNFDASWSGGPTEWRRVAALALSYDVASPALRRGYTRRTWATKDIPVQPYPLDSAKYKLKGSFTDSIWLQVALYPDKKHKSVPSAVFDLTLKPFRNGNARRWLVDSWAPAGYEGIPSGTLANERGPVANVEYKGSLSQGWLLVPISMFALGLVLLVGVGVRGWWRGNRALKQYKSHSL